MLSTTVIATPWAPLTVVARDGVVVQSWFGVDPLVSIDFDEPITASRSITGVTDSVAAWLDGDMGAITRVAVDQPGSAFHQDVWAMMRTIPAGDPWTYGMLAARAGRPRAARAAGTACAINAVAPFVPCHRVVRSTGIGEYGYGVALKTALLAHEAAADPISLIECRGRR